MKYFSAWLLYGLCFLAVNAQLPREQKEDAFNLSHLGAEGVPQAEGIRLSQVFENAPAFLAGLKSGAIILLETPELPKKVISGESEPKEEGENFPPVELQGPKLEIKKREKMVFDFIQKIEEASQTTGKLTVQAKQAGTVKEYILKIPKYGKHAETCPKKCKRCQAMVQHSLEWLAKNQKGGVWDTTLGGETGNAVVTSVCGLALLAAGNYPSGPYAKEVKAAIKYVLRVAGKEDDKGFGGSGKNWNQVNWSLGYAPLFLAECYLRTPTIEIRNKLIELEQSISKNQEESGGWAHGPGGPNALNYVELEIMSNWCLASLGVMQKVKIPVNATTVQKGLDYVIECSSEAGGVGYSTRDGQKAFGDPGRTAGAIFAFAQLKQKEHPFYGKMSSYLLKHMEEVPNGHVSPVMHFMATSLACSQLEESSMKEFMRFFQLELLSARRPDGSFCARPTEESTQMRSNTDLDLGPNWTTGNYLIVLQLHQNHLKIFDKK